MVDTTQLRALRLGPEVHVLLRSLVSSRNLVPPEGVFLNFTSELPFPLGQMLEEVQREGNAWCAWSHRDEVHAVSAAMDETLARTHGRPVLRLCVHDAAGQITERTVWLESEPDVWSPCNPGG